MESSPASRWISFLEHDLLDEEPRETTPDTLFWPQQNGSSQSLENESLRGDVQNQEKETSRKRLKDECYGGTGTKACREKMRRDRLNDRFMELSAVLEPDKPPKTDKASILRDAARILTQLRAEAQQLKAANHHLQETVKELKAEKHELREEKLTLKNDKERLEKQLQSVVVPGYVAHPATAVHAAAAAAVAAYSSQNGKLASFPELPFPTTMSQWLPPATVDISKDPLLRPPVA